MSNTARRRPPAVRERYPLLARAILAGASAQIRNMATVGGNLLQRTRCTYFYDDDGRAATSATPATGCDAIDGFNRIHAILGASPRCVATHPVRHVRGARRARRDRASEGASAASRDFRSIDLHRLPGDTPEIETVLEPGELITAVELPPTAVRGALDLSQGARPGELRLRAGLGRRGAGDGGRTDQGRAASRSAASRTSRGARERAEAALRGGPATEAAFRAAAEAELAAAAAACATTGSRSSSRSA